MMLHLIIIKVLKLPILITSFKITTLMTYVLKLHLIIIKATYSIIIKPTYSCFKITKITTLITITPYYY